MALGTVLLLYLGAINLVTFIAYWLDKRKAKRNAYRISERALLLLAFFGGAVGAALAMILFRHKTNHKKFTICIPLFVCLHIVLVIWLLPTWL